MKKMLKICLLALATSLLIYSCNKHSGRVPEFKDPEIQKMANAYDEGVTEALKGNSKPAGDSTKNSFDDLKDFNENLNNDSLKTTKFGKVMEKLKSDTAEFKKYTDFIRTENVRLLSAIFNSDKDKK